MPNPDRKLLSIPSNTHLPSVTCPLPCRIHHRSRLSAINPLSTADTANQLPFWVIGNEGGFFPNLQPPTITLQMGPAERYDVIIDFSRMMDRCMMLPALQALAFAHLTCVAFGISCELGNSTIL